VNSSAQVILLTNGPGELYTWARPLAHALRSSGADLRLVLALLPCPFASGYERNAADLLPVDAVVPVAQTLEFIAGGRRPEAFQKLERGVVIGLGGDVNFPGRIGARLSYPAWRYSFESFWHKSLERLFVHDVPTLERAHRSGANATDIGNLTADALTLENVPAKQPGLDVIVVPGSRGFQFTHLLPYFAGVAERVRAGVPDVRFHVPRSRLINDADFQTALSGVNVKDFGGVPLRLEESGSSKTLVTPDGTRLELHDEDARYGLMRNADFALTVVGTNTLELGIAGVPSLVCLPLQKMELIPIENPLRYLEWLPVVGKPIKRRLVDAFLSRQRYISLPNRLADEAIQPELRGDLPIEKVAGEALRLLRDPAERARIRARLEATMPRPGAAARLAALILERVGLGA
jgi:lipid-A-disaccharide synthase